jgi:hypothetical protein
MRLPTVKAARESVGGFSNPDKMPCHAISLPIEFCNVGSKLAKIVGTICYYCYAGGGFYNMPVVKKALQRRLDALYAPGWVDGMIRGINGAAHFRWHDAGDIQDMVHLKNIVEVCERTPDTRHWLPTHETPLILQYLRDGGTFPENLLVRLSAVMVDGPAPTFPHTSTVHDKGEPIGQACPAYTQGGQCLDCRACWDENVANVSYPLH